MTTPLLLGQIAVLIPVSLAGVTRAPLLAVRAYPVSECSRYVL